MCVFNFMHTHTQYTHIHTQFCDIQFFLIFYLTLTKWHKHTHKRSKLQQLHNKTPKGFSLTDSNYYFLLFFFSFPPNQIIIMMIAVRVCIRDNVCQIWKRKWKKQDQPQQQQQKKNWKGRKKLYFPKKFFGWYLY